jgi:hypothetical protein
MQQILVGFKRRRAGVYRQQVRDVRVEMLQFPQVNLLLLQVVWQGLVQGDQILQVDPQDRHFKPRTLTVHPSVVTIVTGGGQQLCHLAQGLERRRRR